MKPWGRWMHGHERAVAAVTVVAVAAVALVGGSMSEERRSKPAITGSSVEGPAPPDVDYTIDLNNGVMMPLPQAIIQSPGLQHALPRSPRYALSPDGSLLAYVSNDDEGRLQIFVAGLNGSGVHQVTHDPTSAESPAWSPDGTNIAYVGHGAGHVGNLFVLDVAAGESIQITGETRALIGDGAQFTPDGSALLYTAGSQESPELRAVPLAGGRSRPMIRTPGGLADTGNGSLSPDGSLVTFLGGGTFRAGHCGPCRFVANADGTKRRLIPPCFLNPAGTWSPDGDRIVCSDQNGIIVVDIATGNASHVAEGSGAIWLDPHTLLVEA